MIQKQVKKILKNFKYKTIEFEIDSFKNGQVTITAFRELFHPKSGRSAGELSGTEIFNYRTSNELQFLLALRDWMHLAECHEADEHMLYKGKQIFSPHAAKASLY